MKKKSKTIYIIRSFLKNNEIIFDFVSKIIFGFLSIVLVIDANKIATSQLSIQKESSVPIFLIEEVNNKNSIKIFNKGGKIKNVSIERFDIITLSFGKKKFEETILYKNNAKEIDIEKNSWYFVPSQKFISTLDFSIGIREKLREKYENYNIGISMPHSFYKISYQDYQNNYIEEYYEDTGKSISFTKSINVGDNVDYLSRKDDYTLTAIYNNEQELSEHFLRILITKIDYYLYQNSEK